MALKMNCFAEDVVVQQSSILKQFSYKIKDASTFLLLFSCITQHAGLPPVLMCPFVLFCGDGFFFGLNSNHFLVFLRTWFWGLGRLGGGAVGGGVSQ